jgi:dipeptidyl aminopeptidase/acylaminoacyl peptidase
MNRVTSRAMALAWIVALALLLTLSLSEGLVVCGSPSSPQAPTDQPAPAIVQPQGIISPTSSFLLYSRADDTTIWLKDEAGHAKLLDGIRPRLSPDGRYLVYQNEALFGDLYVRDLASGQDTKVFTATAHLLVPSWTGNGSRIIFDHECHIYGMDRDGSNLELLIDTWPGSNYCYNDSPDVNRMDGRIAWENEYYGLGVAQADGANPYWVPNTQPDDYSPRWSPDGQWLAFWRDDDVYKIRPDGTDLSQLTFVPAGSWMEDSGQWTPNGKYLVAPAQVNGIEGLYAVSAEGQSCLLPLVQREWEDPDWVGSVGNVQQCCTFLPLVQRSSPSQ